MSKKEIKIESVFGQECRYNPLRDAEEVKQGLGVDINDMLQTGVVKDSSETLDNNGIEEPSRIVGRIRDVFDAMDAARIIKKYGKKAPAKAAEGVQNIVDSANVQ